jgi:hypothetical protein
MVISKKVLVKWNSSNKKWYESKKYIYTKIGDEFEVFIEDLTPSSSAKVEVKCDCVDCKNPIVKIMEWKAYNNMILKSGKYYCKQCVSKEIIAKGLLTRLKNGKSFEQWCIENNKQDLLDRWDYELNDCKPSEMSYATKRKYYLKCPKGIHKSELKNIKNFTSGHIGSFNCIKCNSFEQWCIENNRQDVLDRWDYDLNDCLPDEIDHGSSKIKYYFKCPRNLHKSELKNISNFTVGYEGSIKCNQCNSFAQWGIDNLGENFLEKYWDYEKNNELGIGPWEIDKGSNNNKVWIICQEDKTHNSYFSLCVSFTSKNSRCPICNESKGEKECQRVLMSQNFIEINQDNYNYLLNIDKYNNIYFIPQKTFEGLVGMGGGLLSYDFYLFKYNLLIEYQGKYHDGTVPNQSKEDFEKQVEHDRRKKEYAENNKIKLLEIWYWDFNNIEEIIKRELNLI